MNNDVLIKKLENIIEDLKNQESWEDLGYLNYLISRFKKNKDEDTIILIKTFISQKGL